MKKVYLNYKGIDIKEVYAKLPKANQKIITDYIQYCRKDAGEGAIQKYYNKIVQIADIIEKPLDSLTLDDVNNFLALLNLSNRGTDTRNDVKKTLKRFLKWKYDDWNIRFKELRDIKTKKKGSSERLSKKDLLTAEELGALLRGSDSLRYKALISLFYESAGRPEEILKLKWSDLDFNEKEVSLNSSKTGEARVVPIDESILHLKRYYQEFPFPNVKQSDYIFPSPDNREAHLSNQAFNDYLIKLSSTTIKRHIFPYTFRHTRLQEIRPKLSVEAYQKIAGHSIEVALEHYGHLDNEDATKEMRTKVLHIEELTKEEKSEIKKVKKELEILKKKLNDGEEILQNKLKIYFAEYSKTLTNVVDKKFLEMTKK